MYIKFRENDLSDSILITEPEVYVSFGSIGWRGSTGVSGSISLHDGARGRITSLSSDGIKISPKYPLSTFNDDGVIELTGSYPELTRIRHANVNNRALNSTDQLFSTPFRWAEGHFSAIDNLYDYYSRYNSVYTRNFYDYFAVHFAPGRIAVQSSPATASQDRYLHLSRSFTLESWVKPFTTQSTAYDFTIIDRFPHFSLYITGSTGQLVFSGSDIGIKTGSRGPAAGQWSHVVARWGSDTGSFLINLQNVGSFTTPVNTLLTGSVYNISTAQTSSKPPLVIGGMFFFNNLFNAGGTERIPNLTPGLFSGLARKSFNGLISETRVWSTARTDAEISSSYDRVLLSSGSEPNLKTYVRFNEGNLNQIQGFDSPNSPNPKTLGLGSGAFDYANDPLHFHIRPVSWQPNDNPNFTTVKRFASCSVDKDRIVVFSIPSLYYGRQIATGSVWMRCHAYSSSSFVPGGPPAPKTNMVRVLVDDGRGGLYVSGSLCSSSIQDQTQASVIWNKVGNVFYSEGLITITHPGLFEFGETVGSSDQPTKTFELRFRGLEKIPSKQIECRIDAGEMNASNNPSFASLNSQNDRYEMYQEKPVTYISSIGLYNEERKLVGVVKLAHPIRKREKDRLNIRAKLDF